MSGSQKFLSRNRAPRVQIEYDVELYGAEKKVQLPFVMGVISDLAGKSEQPAVGDRKFLEIDVDTFDDRMAAMAPKAQFSVPNTLTGEGNIAVDLTFRKLSDFSPEAIARNVESLRPLLEARQQLTNLMAYMDGKSGAETLIESILAEPALLQSLAGQSDGAADMDAALESLRAKLPPEPVVADTTAATLADLAAFAPDDTPLGDQVSEVLAGIERAADAPSEDTTEAVLASLPDAPQDEPFVSVEDVLAGVDAGGLVTEEVEESADNILSGIERTEDAPEDTGLAEVLASLPDAPEDAALGASVHDVLGAVEARNEEAENDKAADILAGLERVETDEEVDTTADALASLPAAPEDASPEPSFEDVLGTVESGEEVAERDEAADILAGLEPVEEGESDERESLEDILGAMEPAGESSDEGPTADDILARLETGVPETAEEPDSELDDILGGVEDVSDDAKDGDGLDDILAALEPEPFEAEAESDLGELLSDLRSDDTDSPADPQGLDEVLSDIGASEPGAGVSDGEPHEDDGGAEDGLDSLLNDLGADEKEETGDDADLDALLSDLGGGDTDDGMDPVDGMEESSDATGAAPELADDDDLEALLAEPRQDEGPGEDDDLDALLADLDGDDEGDVERGDGDAPAAELSDDLDSLLADGAGGDVSSRAETDDDDDDELDALLADLEPYEATESLSNDVDEGSPDGDDEPEETERMSPPVAAPQSPFGRISQPRPDRASLNRKSFRMALFGDFTGRAARGMIEIGDALAARRGVPLDVDTVEDVIENFATTLTLPIGKDGAGIEVKLGELDDLHPDELYDSVELFDGLSGLRQQLGVASMADNARARLKAWSEEFGTPVKLPKRSAGASVPPHLKLSDFQALIGDVTRSSQPATPIDDLIARIVGPHVVAAPDADAAAMTAAVDEAIGTAMRLILHHPDFQALEAQWRSLDLLARRIETDSDLQIVLYDVSAEELAVDLAAHEDLSESGLFGLLTNALDPEDGAGGFSALIGLYTFEETPPHAEVLARIGQVAAHVDAPFFAAMAPGYLDTAKEDRHPLVAQAWDALRETPEAAYLGLASPRFLLRLPYGAKSDPVSAFDFEEFSRREGLSGMLWANPAVLVAILLAGTFTKDGKAMELGSLMSLGDLPFHYVTDRYGDQVAMPCTERNLTSDPAQATLARGYMPVVWMKGQNEVRLGSFRALSGDEIAGPWSDAVPAARSVQPPPAAAGMAVEMEIEVADEGIGVADESAAEDMDAELEALLAGFEDDDTGDAAGEDDLDAELAALLEGL